MYCYNDIFALLAFPYSSSFELFSTSLEGVSIYVEHLLAAFPSFYGPTHLKPSELGLGRVIVEATYIVSRIIVSLCANRMGWHVASG